MILLSPLTTAQQIYYERFSFRWLLVRFGNTESVPNRIAPKTELSGIERFKIWSDSLICILHFEASSSQISALPRSKFSKQILGTVKKICSGTTCKSPIGRSDVAVRMIQFIMWVKSIRTRPDLHPTASATRTSFPSGKVSGGQFR